MVIWDWQGPGSYKKYGNRNAGNMILMSPDDKTPWDDQWASTEESSEHVDELPWGKSESGIYIEEEEED